MYSKEQQLNKKSRNEKLPRREYIKIVDFVRDISNEQCQIDGCNNPGADIHHPFGRRGDNMGIVTVLCRECHHNLHNGNDKKEREAKVLEAKGIGRENKRLYDEQIQK